jgi:hypothetical protein
VTVSEDALVKNENGGTSVSENKQQLIEDEVDILVPRLIGIAMNMWSLPPVTRVHVGTLIVMI